ncbi:LURP-one-related family protein, partial [Mangrovimonas futianensis]|uniref:LURP-one-related family protein n=1 Tax=Mangrovimonas futianensis TaxID=2895523 RepID=UPI001E63CC79
SPQFCSHTHPVKLAIVRKVKTITDGNFVVQDINGNILFKLKAVDSIFHGRHVLIDAHGNPIVTLRDKVLCLTI